MALTLMTNVASLGAQRNVNKTQNSVAKNVGRLSSGLRINQAGDDAAGLAISSKLSAHIRGLAQAQRNANDGISAIQTADGALAEINGLLTRMRELAVQASNSGTLGSTERGYIDNEFQALEAEIDRIANVTEYNGQTLLDGSLSAAGSGLSMQVGIMDTANDRIEVTVGLSDSSASGLNTTSADLTTAANAQSALGTLDSAISTVATRRASLGSAQNRLMVTVSNLGSMHENLSAANSRIIDTDIAEETAAFTRNQILMQSGISMLAQANQLPSVALGLLG